MRFDKNHIVIDKTLENKDEASAYIKFLQSELLRHLTDVSEIGERIKVIQEKWGLK